MNHKDFIGLTPEERAMLLEDAPTVQRVPKPKTAKFRDGPIPDSALEKIVLATYSLGDTRRTKTPTFVARIAAELIVARARIKELEAAA